MGAPLATAGWLTVAHAAAACRCWCCSCATGGRGDERAGGGLEAASKWYGTTVALGEVSFALGPGVTGLLGKNGAGKSTALKLLAGFATPDRGTVRVLGLDPRVEHGIHRRLGVLPDRDGLWPFMSPLRLVSMLARLRGVADPEAAARRALQEVDFDPDDRRPVKVLSKGNRQRVKLAQALAHDPEVLLLDEPLNGLDPQQRRHVVDLVRDLGERGRTVLVSSHVLHEVERMAPRVVVLVNGRLVAEGATTAIRDLLAERPRTIRVEAADGGAAPLAQALIGDALVGSVRFEEGGLTVETPDAERFARRLPAHARRVGATLRRVEPIGEDLESVYEYLEARAAGSRAVIPVTFLFARALPGGGARSRCWRRRRCPALTCRGDPSREDDSPELFTSPAS